MTSEEDFHRILDAKPTDWTTRLVFADWLQEHDNPRAEGYRALARLKHTPLRTGPAHPDDPDFEPPSWEDGPRQTIEWTWWKLSNGGMEWYTLELSWWSAIEGQKRKRGPGRKSFATRRAAEDAAALAWNKIPQKTRNRFNPFNTKKTP